MYTSYKSPQAYIKTHKFLNRFWYILNCMNRKMLDISNELITHECSIIRKHYICECRVWSMCSHWLSAADYSCIWQFACINFSYLQTSKCLKTTLIVDLNVCIQILYNLYTYLSPFIIHSSVQKIYLDTKGLKHFYCPVRAVDMKWNCLYWQAVQAHNCFKSKNRQNIVQLEFFKDDTVSFSSTFHIWKPFQGRNTELH